MIKFELIKQKIKKIKDKKIVFFLFFIVLGAFLLRVYNFEEWLLFRADQARDAYYAKEVFDGGIKQLKLLGPKLDLAYLEGDANPRGYSLCTGPFYYYLQYFFVFLFGSISPWVMALPDFLMFIASIPLFFYLGRQFFNKYIALAITGLYAFSFFNLIFTRFAWNPNQLFFWEILLVLSLVKLISTKDHVKKGRWFVTAFLSLIIISNLHFVALLGFSLMSVFFFLFFFKKIRFQFKYLFYVLGVLIIFSTPLIVSDIKNDGDNAKRFWTAVTRENEENRSILKKSSITYKKQAEFFTFALTSFNEKEIKQSEYYGAIFLGFSLGLGFLLLIFSNLFKITDKEKILLFLISTWFFSFFLVFLSIFHKLGNLRYFITMTPWTFLILGAWFHGFLKIKFKKIVIGVISLICLLLVFFNLQASYEWYNGLESGQIEKRSGLKLDAQSELIGYGHMRKAFSRMIEFAEKDSKQACFYSSNYQYNLGFQYINETEFPDKKTDRFGRSDERLTCKFFIAGLTKRGERDIPKEFFERFEVIDSEKFGALTIWEIDFQDDIRKEIISSQKKEEVISQETEKISSEDRKIEKWQDVFSK